MAAKMADKETKDICPFCKEEMGVLRYLNLNTRKECCVQCSNKMIGKTPDTKTSKQEIDELIAKKEE